MLKWLLFYWMILVFVCDVFFLSKNSVSLKCPITTAGTLLHMNRPLYKETLEKENRLTHGIHSYGQSVLSLFANELDRANR